MKRNEINKGSVGTGKSKIFFDIKNPEKANPYLQISKSGMNGKRQELTLFQDNLNDMIEKLIEIRDSYEQDVKGWKNEI